MAVGFHTCLDCVTGSNRQHLAANVLDANKRVLFVEDSEGNTIGRVVLGLVEANGRKALVPLSYFYQSNDLNIAPWVVTYLKAYSEHVGVPLIILPKQISRR